MQRWNLKIKYFASNNLGLTDSFGQNVWQILVTELKFFFDLANLFYQIDSFWAKMLGKFI